MKSINEKAQAATELAIFGAVLIFVVGGIIRSSFDAGLSQNQSLKAMRWALLQSLYGIRDVNKSRESASLTVIEDRLSPEAGRYGATERAPSLQAGSGTFTNTLFMPMDWMETHNIPVTDVIVNGDHFTFSTARFTMYNIMIKTDGGGDYVELWDLTNNTKKRLPKKGNWDDACYIMVPLIDPNTNQPFNSLFLNSVGQATDGLDGPVRVRPLVNNIPNGPVVNAPNGPIINAPNGPVINAGGPIINAGGPLSDFYQVKDPDTGDLIMEPQLVPGGCPIFYTVVPVNSSSACFDDDGTCDPDSPISLEQRFDLNRNGNSLDDPKPELYKKMMWQWDAVRGVVGKMRINAREGVYPSFDVDGDRKEEVIYGVNGSKPASCELNKPCVLSPSINPTAVPDLINTSVVQYIRVLDYQKGDMDFSMDAFDYIGVGTSAPTLTGLRNEVSVYTTTKDGTYLQIKEGKAYVPETGEFVRSAHRRDQVDFISRMFQISNNTQRFCHVQGGVLKPTDKLTGGLLNPVEYCVDTKNSLGSGNCFDTVRINATCYDIGTNIIYMRSRIEEKRGHKWVTQTK